jgi:Iap family predicted aminopeptidase
VSSRALTAVVVGAVMLCVAVTAAMGPDSARHMRIPADTPEPSAAASAMAGEGTTAITQEGIDEHLDALQRIADDHAGTRAAGTGGDRATVAYLVAQLEAAGWLVRTQAFRVPVFVERPGSPRLIVPRGGPRVARSAYRAMTYSGSGTVTARVRPIALRPGRASDSGCDRRDFTALRPGEIALVQRGTCLLSLKARNAQRAGAAAVLIANDGVGSRTHAFAGTLGQPGLRIPALALATAPAARLAGHRVTVRVQAVSQRAEVDNVIADSPAATNADRIVMAGAHLDSVAAGPGINDDGSGVAALLEVAEAVRDQPVRIGFWAAEELGLDGSRHYVDGLTGSQRDRISAYLNLDMVGTPGGALRVYGQREVAQALDLAAGGALKRTSIGGASDHASFARVGIPVGGLYTGTHGCYHRACDTVRRVDRPLVRRAAVATERAVQTLTR